jgi:hypothetical protein
MDVLCPRARGGIRTLDLFLTMEAPYHLATRARPPTLAAAHRPVGLVRCPREIAAAPQAARDSAPHSQPGSVALATVAAKASTSSAVVSHEHIQRTTPASSSQT